MPGVLEENLKDITELLQKKSETEKTIIPLVNLYAKTISNRFRETLLTWVLDTSSSFNLSIHTGLLACSYIDKFLSIKQDFSNGILDLLGVVAISIASRFNEKISISPPAISKALESKFTIEMVLSVELLMLQVLDWKLNMTTPCEIIGVLLESTVQKPESTVMLKVASAFSSVCYVDSELASYGNFLIAVSSILLAIDKLGISGFKKTWLERARIHSLSDCKQIVCKVYSKILKNN